MPKDNYGMGEFVSSIDTILWGRKTYDIGLKLGGGQLAWAEKLKNYVFTHNPPDKAPAGFEFMQGPVGAFAARLRAEAGKDIWMMGGGELIGLFLDAGEIDEFSIHVVPIFIGEGIPMVQPRHRSVPLKLISTKAFEDGMVHLNYAVQR
jgi:dihydrofolate reductase